MKFARTASGRIYAETLKDELKGASVQAIELLEGLLIHIRVRPDDEPVIVTESETVIFNAEAAKEELSSRLMHYRHIIKGEHTDVNRLGTN